MRYFTPNREIAFCGHATVATFHVLAVCGRVSLPGSYVLRCSAGPLAVTLEAGENGCQVWLTTPQFPFVPSPVPAAELLALLGATGAPLDPVLPIVRCGPRIYVPLARRADVTALHPRFQALRDAGARHDVHGFYVFSRETVLPGSVTHGRYFAPYSGVLEDPVTGSASGPLAMFLRDHGVLGSPSRARAEQGFAMGRPGTVLLDVDGSGQIRIGGEAVTAIEGRLAGWATGAQLRP
jgi:PhzF family phenazine biosynthesis protein